MQMADRDVYTLYTWHAIPREFSTNKIELRKVQTAGGRGWELTRTF